jgi:predicted TIM-barrel fold metal-dependent hydrolase
MKCIDFHTHVFPDAIAARAMASLEKEGGEKAFLDGTLASLRRSMAQTGIDHAVIASIATRPEQFDPMLKWSQAIRTDDIIPFLSVHPRDPHILERIRIVKAEGFKGIKLHPYYQDFVLDDESLFPAYEAIENSGLVLLVHTGFDMAFERVRCCDPQKIVNVITRFPSLKLVTTHCGAWEDWDEVETHLLGRPVYMDISYSIGKMGEERFRRFLNTHPSDYLVFGTDSPWADQQAAIADAERAITDPQRLEKLFFTNAARLLDIPSA